MPSEPTGKVTGPATDHTTGDDRVAPRRANGPAPAPALTVASGEGTLLERMAREPAWDAAVELAREELHAIADCTPLQVQLLHNRGVRGAAEARGLLDAGWRGTARALPGLPAALDRIAQALARAERITVFGDYDSDGMTSCAILVLALRALGATVGGYIPRRDDDGRGLNDAAVRQLAAAGTQLIITTDCGMANVAEVLLARSLGVDVVVTDHHSPQGEVAPAWAVVNPALDPAAGDLADLAGAGVAFRVAEALLTAQRGAAWAAEQLETFLDLAAIGTIGDIVPLTRESWRLAHAGLRRLNEAPRPGVRALLTKAGVAPGDITERDIGFVIAPRLNAAARLGEPETALRLLLTEDAAEATTLASQLDTFNLRRQEQLEQMMLDARVQGLAQIEAAPAGGPAVLVVVGEGWPLGIIGLVASRLADEFGRPTFALSRDGTECRGSGRAPEGYDLVGALATRAALFKRFGGHKRAAGFTIAIERLDELLAFLRTLDARGAPPEDGTEAGTEAGARAAEHLRADCYLPLSHVDLERYQAVRALAPYGQGFAEPLFACRGVRLVRCWRSGPDGRTLRLLLRDGAAERVVLWPKQGPQCDTLRAALPTLPALDILYTLGAYRSRPGSPLELTPRVRAARFHQ